MVLKRRRTILDAQASVDLDILSNHFRRSRAAKKQSLSTGSSYYSAIDASRFLSQESNENSKLPAVMSLSDLSAVRALKNNPFNRPRRLLEKLFKDNSPQNVNCNIDEAREFALHNYREIFHKTISNEGIESTIGACPNALADGSSNSSDDTSLGQLPTFKLEEIPQRKESRSSESNSVLQAEEISQGRGSPTSDSDSVLQAEMIPQRPGSVSNETDSFLQTDKVPQRKGSVGSDADSFSQGSISSDADSFLQTEEVPQRPHSETIPGHFLRTQSQDTVIRSIGGNEEDDGASKTKEGDRHWYPLAIFGWFFGCDGENTPALPPKAVKGRKQQSPKTNYGWR